MPEKDEYIKFKNYGKKIKSPFMFYWDFESILVQDNNVKQNLEEFMQANTKNVLLEVMAINYYVLIISFVSLFKHT